MIEALMVKLSELKDILYARYLVILSKLKFAGQITIFIFGISNW